MTDTKLNFTPHTVTQFNESEDIIVILSDLNPKKEVVEAVEEPEGEDAVEEEDPGVYIPEAEEPSGA